MDRSQELGPIWRECFNLAVEAMAAGSLGISAVVATATGEVLSRGRNQLHDSQESCNIVRKSHVAHAELNAIASIPDSHRDNRNLTLYTTVEPCPLCIGAIAMSRIRNVCIASRDGWAGSMDFLENNSYLTKKNIHASYETGTTEKVFFLLHLISLWLLFDEDRRKDRHFFAELAKYCSAYLPLVERIGRDVEFIRHVAKRDEVAIMKMLCNSALDETP